MKPRSRVSPIRACKNCGADIVFIRLLKKPGEPEEKRESVMPCDARLYQGDYKATLVTANGLVIAKAPFEVIGRVPHFATCSALMEDRAPVAPSEKATSDPQPGEKARCEVCSASIVYIGPHWQHERRTRSTHAAIPRKGKQRPIGLNT